MSYETRFGWSGWESLGGAMVGGPGAVLQSRGRLAVFIRGTDDQCHHRWQTSRNGNWSNWESIGGTLTSDPDAALNADASMVVFARGNDGALWHAWQNTTDGTWSNWESLGGKLKGGPGSVLQTRGRLAVFIRGTDDQCHHRWQTSRNGNWSNWESIGGTLTSDPDAALNADGGMVVFARGPDDAVWHSWQGKPDGNWSPWISLGGQTTSSPTAAVDNAGRLHVFAEQADSQIWMRRQITRNGNWGPWTALGGLDPTSSPDCAMNAVGGRVVFTRGSNGELWHRWEGFYSIWVPEVVMPEIPRAIVPDVIGELYSEAKTAIEAAGLRAGIVWNQTNESRTDRLRVIGQNPAGGTSVTVGRGVALSVELAQTAGVKEIKLYNCNSSGRSVNVWVFDSGNGQWQQHGMIPNHYTNGVCPNASAQPLTVTLQNKRLYRVVAVDVGNINCAQNDPTNINCQRWMIEVVGDPGGMIYTQTIA